ncbi:glycosyltransferase family 9 protein [Rubellicoccus peritrichatus]|uniref:Glycosyltransferase family 9 protein n=1 Tax=Rubellicoccus peritrichatus TaxID=3080537 RepID=A0AAQ3L7S4_9BACT|nr:glycosyltransferase family 9 protein [Puniceicoccus sp. CR14]WOO40820.1 glycosyltransferase family 9 protein [Puniceicoccus sp. CR14]
MGLSQRVFALLLKPLGKAQPLPKSPQAIFVLRNNDLGDVLVITPVFAALKKRFPKARIIAGVGDWAAPLLKGNPNIDAIVTMNAPWHNKANCRHSPNSPMGFLLSLKYILFSTEAKALRQEKADVGIDILGSPQGTLLMARADIPYRIGVRGYAGGDTGCQASVDFDSNQTVANQAFKQLTLLGATSPEETRPQIYLSQSEIDEAQTRWGERKRRLVIAPGSGIIEKSWPIKNFCNLAKLCSQASWDIAIIGGAKDKQLGAAINKAIDGKALDMTGSLTMRETCAMVQSTHSLIGNSSVAIHIAAAFSIPTLVVLGPLFESASQHQKQWGSPGQIHLGRDTDKPQIATPDEAYTALESLSSK